MISVKILLDIGFGNLNQNSLQWILYYCRFFKDKQYNFEFTQDINTCNNCDIFVFLACGSMLTNYYNFSHILAKKKIIITCQPCTVFQYSEFLFNQFTDIVSSVNNINISNNIKVHSQFYPWIQLFVGFNMKQRNF